MVEGIVGILHSEVTIEGFGNHAGTTPMDQRHDALLAAARFIDKVLRRINKDRVKPREVIGLSMQQQKTRLRGNRDPNLIIDFQSAATFEALLGHKDLDVSEKLRLIGRREPGIESDVLPD